MEEPPLLSVHELAIEYQERDLLDEIPCVDLFHFPESVLRIPDKVSTV